MSDITSEYLCIIASYFIHLCTAHTTQYIRGYVEPARGLLCVLVYSLLYFIHSDNILCNVLAICPSIQCIQFCVIQIILYRVSYVVWQFSGSALLRNCLLLPHSSIHSNLNRIVVLLFVNPIRTRYNPNNFSSFVQKLDGINSKVYGVDWNQSFWCVYNVRFLCKCVQCALRYTVIRWWILYFFACFLATNCYNTSGDKFSRTKKDQILFGFNRLAPRF